MGAEVYHPVRSYDRQVAVRLGILSRTQDVSLTVSEIAASHLVAISITTSQSRREKANWPNRTKECRISASNNEGHRWAI